MKRKQQKGAAAIEFALIGSLLITLVLGVLDYGWFFFSRANVQEAAWQGVRLAKGAESLSDAQTEGTEAAQAILENAGIDVDRATIRTTTTQVGSSEVLQLQVQLNYQPIIGLFPMPSILSTQASAVWAGE